MYLNQPIESTNLSAPTAHILRDECVISPLTSVHRISVILPSQYQETNTDFPVLYLLEACLTNNVVVRESVEYLIDQLKSYREELPVILVTIDPIGGSSRKDYSPYYNPLFGIGHGKYLIDFLVREIDPEVKRNFRVAAGSENTAIGGSFMGGLLSLYAGIRKPDIFGGVLAFSPSLWISPMIYHDLDEKMESGPCRIYICSGRGESKFYNKNILRVQRIVERKQAINTQLEMNFVNLPESEQSKPLHLEQVRGAISWLYA